MKINFRWDCRSNLDDGSPTCVVRVPPKKPYSKALQVEIDKGFELQSYYQTRSGRNVCVPPPPDALPPLHEATLAVFNPLGHRLMDEILISLLIFMNAKPIDDTIS